MDHTAEGTEDHCTVLHLCHKIPYSHSQHIQTEEEEENQ